VVLFQVRLQFLDRLGRNVVIAGFGIEGEDPFGKPGEPTELIQDLVRFSPLNDNLFVRDPFRFLWVKASVPVGTGGAAACQEENAARPVRAPGARGPGAPDSRRERRLSAVGVVSIQKGSLQARPDRRSREGTPREAGV